MNENINREENEIKDFSDLEGIKEREESTKAESSVDEQNPSDDPRMATGKRTGRRHYKARARAAAEGREFTAKDAALEWIKDIIIAVIIAVIVLQFIKPASVKQHSMEPNFYTDDYLIVSKQSYKLLGGTPELGDVIIFKSSMTTEDGDSKLLIKRVIGVPGDVIDIYDGKVYLNGEELDDSYTKDQYTNETLTNVVVPDDCVFVLGDNRLVSVDSRYDSVGFVSYDDIVGKVVLRLYPFSSFGTIDNPYED